MALQAHEQYIYMRASSIVFSILNPIVNVVVLFFGGKAVALSIVCLVLSLVSYLVHIIFAVKVIKFRMSFKGIQFSYFKEIFIFSGFLFINSITDQITSSTDGVIIGSICGTAAVSVYTIGAQFKNYFTSFSVAISGVFAPRVNDIVAKTDSNEELDELFIRIGRIQFYILSLMLIGYIAIGRDFIVLWAGSDYRESYMIGLILIMSTFVPLFQNVGLEIQKAKNKHKARSIVYFIIAATNLCLTIPFTKRWGGLGAAMATLICVFGGTVLFMNYYYAKGVGLNILKFWKSIFGIVPGFLPSIITGVVIFRCFVLDSYWKILAATGIIMVTYLLPVWFFSMNEYEKELFKSPVRRIIGRSAAKK
jgi:O-antigen/teichoic acid export membrane protein